MNSLTIPIYTAYLLPVKNIFIIDSILITITFMFYYCTKTSVKFYFQSHKMAWPFLEPVDPNEVPDYYTVIKDPMGKLLQCC